MYRAPVRPKSTCCRLVLVRAMNSSTWSICGQPSHYSEEGNRNAEYIQIPCQYQTTKTSRTAPTHRCKKNDRGTAGESRDRVASTLNKCPRSTPLDAEQLSCIFTNFPVFICSICPDSHLVPQELWVHLVPSDGLYST